MSKLIGWLHGNLASFPTIGILPGNKSVLQMLLEDRRLIVGGRNTEANVVSKVVLQFS